MALPPHAGIYYVGPILDNANAVFDPAVIDMPEIHGVMIRAPWENLEPLRGVLNRDLLDPIVSRCVAKDKKIGFMTLFGNMMPDWAKNAIPNATFTLDRGDGRTRTVTTPIPWSPVYHEAVANHYRLVADYLKSADAIDLVTYIRLATVVVDGGELGLPRPRNQTGDPNAPEIRQWFMLGYRPSKVVSGYMTMARAAAAPFPSTVQIGQGLLNTGSFPAINEDGSVGSKSTTRNDIMRALAQAFPGRVGAGDQSLMPEAARPLDESQTEAVAFGHKRWFQTNKQGGDGAAGDMQGTPATATTYLEILRTGLKHGPIVEVFDTDAKRFPRQIAKAWAEKVAREQGSPSSTPAPASTTDRPQRRRRRRRQG